MQVDAGGRLAGEPQGDGIAALYLEIWRRRGGVHVDVERLCLRLVEAVRIIRPHKQHQALGDKPAAGGDRPVVERVQADEDFVRAVARAGNVRRRAVERHRQDDDSGLIEVGAGRERTAEVADGDVVGMISDRDLKRVAPTTVQDFEQVEGAQARLGQSVASLMSGDVLSVGPTTDIGEVIDLMLEEKVGAIPVLDDETGDLVGIVSYVDILRALRRKLDES